MCYFLSQNAVCRSWKNIVYRVHIAIFAQYRVHIAIFAQYRVHIARTLQKILLRGNHHGLIQYKYHGNPSNLWEKRKVKGENGLKWRGLIILRLVLTPGIINLQMWIFSFSSSRSRSSSSKAKPWSAVFRLKKSTLTAPGVTHQIGFQLNMRDKR